MVLSLSLHTLSLSLSHKWKWKLGLFIFLHWGIFTSLLQQLFTPVCNTLCIILKWRPHWTPQLYSAITTILIVTLLSFSDIQYLCPSGWCICQGVLAHASCGFPQASEGDDASVDILMHVAASCGVPAKINHFQWTSIEQNILHKHRFLESCSSSVTSFFCNQLNNLWSLLTPGREVITCFLAYPWLSWLNLPPRNLNEIVNYNFWPWRLFPLWN